MSKTPSASHDPHSAVPVVNGTERRAWGTFLSTFLQTMAPVFFLILFLLVLLLFFFLPLLEESYLHQKRRLCKYLIQVQMTYLEALHSDVLKGTISAEEAQGRALRRLRTHRFGDAEKDYFWVLGPERTLVMHPYRPDLEGISPDEAKGPDGELLRGLFDGIEEAATRTPEGGHLDYLWHFKDDLEKLSAKTSHVARFVPWDWIVGTGVYLDDIHREIASWRRRFTLLGLFAVLGAGGLSLFLSIRAVVLGRKAALFAVVDRSLREKTRALLRTEKQLAIITSVYDHASEGVVITEPDGAILRVNRAFTEITGFSRDEAIGQNPRILKSNTHGRKFFEQMWRDLLEKKRWSGEIWNRRKNGEAFPAMLNIVACLDDSGETTHYIGVFQDLSELHRSRDSLLHETFHDSLTGLPNRFLFSDRLAMALARARENAVLVSVIILGLDRFSSINKTLGYPAGDLLLKEAGSRIAEAVGGEGTAARFGGDEFVILIPKSSDLHSVLRTTQRMLASLRTPFSIEGESLRLTASAGVALYPRDGDTPENLLQNASLAMERAKKEGGDSYRLFTETLDRKVQQRIRLEGDLRNAIDKEAFSIHYQPKISMMQGKTSSVEALLRWTNKENESIPPDVFIPLAEDIGEINSLGRFVLERSCLQAKEWRDEGRDIVMCVNVSAKQLASESFVHSVLSVLERTGTPPHALELEITESAFMSNPEYATRVMEELMEHGLRFTLDDFGTGYSSLSYIRSLPLAGIKIDRSFTAELDNSKTRAIVSTIMHMAGELNLELTVEGIETRAELDAIRSLAPRDGDIMLQGYLFSRPVPPDTCSSLFDRDFF